MLLIHSSERELSVEFLFAARGLVQSPAAPRCFGPLSGNSKSATTDNRIVADNESQVASGSGAVANSAPAVTGSGNNVGGLTVEGNSGTIHLESVDPDVVISALNSVQNLASQTLAAAAQTTDKTNALFASLAESKQTEGAAQQNKYVLWAALAAIGLGALYLNRKA